MLWDPDGSVECVWYAQLVPCNKELPEIYNSLMLGDASWRRGVRESSSHDLEAMDDLSSSDSVGMVR